MKSESRTYSSPLRDENAERTKRKILEATLRVLAEGPAELSMPAVAAEAGVSVPTVYRHYGSKRGLQNALYEHHTRLIGVDFEPGEITGVESFIERMPEIFRKNASMDEATRLALSTPYVYKLRRQKMPQRQAMMVRALRASGVPPREIERLTNLFTIFTSTALQRAFEDYLEIGPDDAAELVGWAMRTLLDSVKEKKQGKGRR